MGEDLSWISAEFNKSIKIEARAERLTSDAGVLALREALERLGMWEWLAERLPDTRNPDLVTHPLSELVRTSVLALAQGYRDHDDLDAMRMDPALRLAVSDRKGVSPLTVPDRPEGAPVPRNPAHPEHLPSQPTMSRFTSMASSAEARRTLREGLPVLAGRRIVAEAGRRLRHLTIDIDSLPVEVHGNQPDAAYNGHYGATIYHPLIALAAETGDLLDVSLRRGNVHTAEDALEFILPLVDRAERDICRKASVRVDAGFPDEKTLRGLEQRNTPYVARVKNNAVLDRMAEPFMRRPVGRRPKEPRTWFQEMTYKAESWSRARRVVLVVLEREDDLFLHHFWLITNRPKREMNAAALLEHYRQRGTAEGHFGELMSVLNPALSSTDRPKQTYAGKQVPDTGAYIDAFAVNEVRFLLNAWAYGAMHVCRRLTETATQQGWSLQRFRDRVLKVAARVLLHERRVTIVIADSATRIWRALWQRIARMPRASTA